MDFVKGGEERGGKGKRGKGKRGKDTRKRGKGKDISHTKGYACASLVCPCVSLRSCMSVHDPKTRRKEGYINLYSCMSVHDPKTILNQS
jgi:hypothetical protein